MSHKSKITFFNVRISLQTHYKNYVKVEKVCNKVGMDKSEITFNPEFLREGTAIEDFFNPDRIVIGGNDHSKVAVLKELYKNFDAELIETDPVSSQLIKYLANTYLPLRLSFVNEATKESLKGK